jgi:hypothetical protein
VCYKLNTDQDVFLLYGSKKIFFFFFIGSHQDSTSTKMFHNKKNNFFIQLDCLAFPKKINFFIVTGKNAFRDLQGQGFFGRRTRIISKSIISENTVTKCLTIKSTWLNLREVTRPEKCKLYCREVR